VKQLNCLICDGRFVDKKLL
jgi:hypothetical protein